MTPANVVLLNISATLLRMLASVGLGLLTTRVAYRSLTEQGFGAYAACLALVAMLPILIEALASSAQRHIAHAIGKEDNTTIRSLTGSFVTQCLLLAAGFTGLLAAFAPYLANLITAPEPYAEALAATIRWIAVITGVQLIQTPFKSYLIARQSIALLTVFELAESIARLAAALLLLRMSEPGIDDFARWTAVLCTIPATLLIAMCFWRHPATRPGRLLHLRQIAGMGMWISVGTLGWKVRTQGAQLMINAFAGAAGSAAYGIALQLSLYQNNLSSAVYRAVRPAVVTAAGKAAAATVAKLQLTTNKTVSMLTLIFAAPLLLETEAILRLWIGDAPPLMVTMTRLVVLWMALKDLTLGHLAAIHARGVVAKHESTNTMWDLIGLALAALSIWLWDTPVWVVPLATVLVVITQSVIRVRVFSGEGREGLVRWLTEVVVPYASVALLGSLAPLAILFTLPPSPGRIAAVFASAAIGISAAILAVGMNQDERTLVQSSLTRVRTKLFGHPAG